MFFTEWQIFTICVFITVIMAIHIVGMHRKHEPYGFLDTINLLLIIILLSCFITKFIGVKIS